MKLSKYEIQDLIERLQKGENIPDDYKYKLFPTKQKEYELVYGGKMRKEDVLANEDGVFPVPLQIEKIFNGKRKSWEDGWKNIIAFGDNLQFLKTIYENKDPLIKDKVNGNVKLIYIDPPFATESDFNSKEGQLAYVDKITDAEFIEYLRKRLILAKEILSNDGTIYCHIDAKKGHIVKIIMDEIFPSFQFAEIIWVCGLMGSGDFFPKSHETIFCYRSPNATFNPPHRLGYSKRITNALQKDDSGWFYTRGRESSGGTKALKTYISKNPNLSKKEAVEDATKNRPQYAWDVWIGKKDLAMEYNDQPVGTYAYTKTEKIGYPTQKPEQLLKRIILASTNENDIVLDFFSGSGTTPATAEKLNRKWISCDIGKLSFYTIQKRILNIDKSELLDTSRSKYAKKAKSFVTVNTGQYDLEKIFNLKSAEYSSFVLNLFEITPIKKTISGIKINGQRNDGYYAMIWPYWEFEDASIDEDYLYNLHSNIGKKVGDRLYIVAPASYVNFISDYFEIGAVRYYFLKVPYHIIKELHKVQFKKFRQPQSKKNVNDLEDAIGFHFMKQPEVETKILTTTQDVKICIKQFYSDFSEDDKGKELGNLESLAMVLIDKDFDGQAFDMDEYYFAEDLLPKTKSKKGDENIGNELKKIKEINLPVIPKKECGRHLMIIYVDIYGNEFKENFEIKQYGRD